MSGAPETLLNQGYQARREDRFPEARLYFADAVDLCREAEDRVLLAKALTGLGQIESDLRHFDVAIGHYREAVDIYRTLDQPLTLAHTVRHVADILRRQVRLDLAEPHYQEALEIYRSHAQTPPLDLANAIRGYALLKTETGETNEARRLWQEARGLYADVGVQEGVTGADRQIALLAS